MEAVSEITPENNAGLPAEESSPPKKKRVWLKRLLWTLLAGIAVLLVVVAFFLGPIVKFAVNKSGASILGVDKCSIGDLAVYPFAGYVRVRDVTIGKPTDTEIKFSRDLLSLEYLEFDFEMLTLFSQKKIINRIELKNLYLRYEKNSPDKSNVEVIAARFVKPESEKPEPETPEKEEAESEPIYLAARYVDIENINVNAYFNGMPTPIPPVSFEFKEGIGMDEDLTPMQFGMRFAGNFMNVFRALHGTMLGDLAGAGLGAISDAVGFTADAVSDAAQGTINIVTDVADVTADAAGAGFGIVSDVAGATTDAVSGTAKKVFNLFSSDEKEEEKEADKQK